VRGTLAQSEHLVKGDELEQEDTDGFESVGSILRRLLGVTEHETTHAEVIHDGLSEMEEAQR